MRGSNIVVRRQWAEPEGVPGVRVAQVPVTFLEEPVFVQRGHGNEHIGAKRWHAEALRVGGVHYAYRHFSAGMFIADFGMVDDLDHLRSEHERLALEVAELKGQVRDLQQQIEPPALRDLTDEAAKAEIKTFFADHHGETIYASDVAAALSLDYDKVAQWLQELEHDGEITTPATDPSGTDDADARAG